MRRISLFVALVAGTAMAAGCGWQPGHQASARGGLAVIDLDYIAKETGRSKEISDILSVQKNALDQYMANYQKKANEALDEKKKEFGEQMTDEQKKDLVTLANNLRGQVVQEGRKAQAAFENSRQKLLVQFRSEIKPLAQEIAANKGLSVVIPKNEGFLLSVDPGVDITADVIKAFHARKPAPSAATAAAPAPAVKTPKPANTAEASPSTETR